MLGHKSPLGKSILGHKMPLGSNILGHKQPLAEALAKMPDTQPAKEAQKVKSKLERLIPNSGSRLGMFA